MDASNSLIPLDAELISVSPKLLELSPAAIYLATLSQNSRRTMRESLDWIARSLTRGQADAATFNWAALRYPHTVAIRAKIAEEYSVATANKMLSALCGVLRAAFDLRQIGAEDYTQAVSIRPIPGEALPKGRAISEAEVAGILEACLADPAPSGARDAAIFTILRVGGLRRAEVCDLDVKNFHPKEMTLAV